MKMLANRMNSVKKLAKKVKVIGGSGRKKSTYKCLPSDNNGTSSSTTPTGSFAVYVGEEGQRFTVPTSYLCHPWIKMLLEKARDEFGFGQTNGLVVPCSVAAFQEVVSVAGCSRGQFDLGNLIQEFM